jgi:hypothetical protein
MALIILIFVLTADFYFIYFRLKEYTQANNEVFSNGKKTNITLRTILSKVKCSRNNFNII